jgi:hypothetical protein
LPFTGWAFGLAQTWWKKTRERKEKKREKDRERGDWEKRGEEEEEGRI